MPAPNINWFNYNAAPLDSVTSVMNAARFRLNDELVTLNAVSGRVLENNSCFTQQGVNNAWRKLQAHLGNLGVTELKQEQVITELPVVSNQDPAIQVYINWFNYYDGGNLFPAPVLPCNLILPLKIWERPSGQNAVWGIQPMEQIVDGLPGYPKQCWNACWEWRAGSVYMPGSLQVMDLRVLYIRSLGDFLDSGDNQWFQQPVPLVYCQDAFSLFLCAEFADSREDMDGEAWREKAEAAAGKMKNREVAMKQRTNVRRRSRSGRLEGYNLGYY